MPQSEQTEPTDPTEPIDRPDPARPSEAADPTGTADPTAPAGLPALTALGLSPAEQAGYELLLDRPGTTPADLAAGWARPESLPETLAALLDKNLISPHPDAPDSYRAVPPEQALDALQDHHEHQLRLARAYAEHLAATSTGSAATPAPGTVVEVVHSQRAIIGRLLQIHRGVRRQVRRLDRHTSQPDRLGLAALTRTLLTRGVACRTIYDQAGLDNHETLSDIDSLIQAGQQTRVLPEVPLSLYLADHRVAVLVSATADHITIVHPSTVLDAFDKLFEALWQRALPLHTPTSGSARQTARTASTGGQQLVSLLLSGLTDDAISRQLGTSHRTVQRRIAALMDELGVRTRFQAGMQAAFHDLPTTPTTPPDAPTDGT